MGKDEYKTQRNPAWTDRIIYRGKGLELLNYDSNNFVKLSDHRPVFAQFELDMDQEIEGVFDFTEADEKVGSKHTLKMSAIA
jgi:hypothetical protein